MFETKLEKIVGNEKKLRKLLSLEKRRRGVSDDTLVFVGTSNVANHWWCTQKAVFQSKADEVMFFGIYLSDRITYAHQLGAVINLPTRSDQLLALGRDITLDKIEQLLQEKKGERDEMQEGVSLTTLYKTHIDSEGKTTYLVNPFVSPEEIELIGVPESQLVYDLEKDPIFRGEIYHERSSEKYPTIRWNFQWRYYTVIGMPDGLTDDFVYEYKTTRERFLFNFVKPVAVAQVNLYGYFFCRPRKRLQIYIIDEDRTETFEGAVDLKKAEETLEAFASVDAGGPAYPPKKWKCSKCEFRSTCHVRIY